MAGAAQAASVSPVAAGSCCSQTIQIATRRPPLSLSFRTSRVFHQCLTRPRHRDFYRRWISAVSQVAVDSKSNSLPVVVPELEIKADEEALKESTRIINEGALSAVMADVATLIKIIDTRDIVELELKHHDYELTIKKKEALAPPVAAPSLFLPQMDQSPYSAYPLPPVAPTPVAASMPPAPANTPAPVSSTPAANGLSILSPMTGTFYKSSAPGDPPFVKVGDKVTKGQVICIVEAMKLMNEIEADQTGIIVEVVAEDGKPVSVDTPLFAIRP